METYGISYVFCRNNVISLKSDVFLVWLHAIRHRAGKYSFFFATKSENQWSSRCLTLVIIISTCVFSLALLDTWESASMDWVSRLPEQQPCWLYALIALLQHSLLPRKFSPSQNWLSLRCLTSVIVRELVLPSWHQPLMTTHVFKHFFAGISRQAIFNIYI